LSSGEWSEFFQTPLITFFKNYLYKHIHPVWVNRKNESAYVISCDMCHNDVMIIL